MGKNTFGKVMPRALTQQLQLMGEQIMLARKRRHLSMQDIADRATVTRLTVSKVEHGDPDGFHGNLCTSTLCAES